MHKAFLLIAFVPSLAFAQAPPPAGNKAQQQSAADADVGAQKNSTNNLGLLAPTGPSTSQNCDEINAGSYGSPAFGVTLDFQHKSTSCDRRLDTYAFLYLGLKQAAVYRMCQEDLNYRAMTQAYGLSVCPLQPKPWWKFW